MRAAAAVGSIGLLNCYAEGAPDVSFSWRRNGILLSDGSRDIKYNAQTNKVSIL